MQWVQRRYASAITATMWTGSGTGISPASGYARNISPLPYTQLGDTHPHHKHCTHEHNHVPRPPHRLTQDVSTAITRKMPVLNAVLSEAWPVDDGELGVCGQGVGVHALCQSSIGIQERKDGLMSQCAMV